MNTSALIFHISEKNIPCILIFNVDCNTTKNTVANKCNKTQFKKGRKESLMVLLIVCYIQEDNFRTCCKKSITSSYLILNYSYYIPFLHI